MTDRLGDADGDGNLFCLDSACPYGYLTRLLCDEIANRGWIPRILPKSNTTCKNGGSQARGDSTRTHRDDPDKFMSGLPQRSIIEAVFGAIKKMYGNHLRDRGLARQKREAATRVICYNIEAVARSHAKTAGSHTDHSRR